MADDLTCAHADPAEPCGRNATSDVACRLIPTRCARIAGPPVDLGGDLRAAAAALSGDLGVAVTDAFGAVGARFAAALAEAGAGLANSVTTIGDAVAASGGATASAANDYDDAEHRARAQIAGI